MHQSQLLKTNESQWSILLKRWCVTRRPHRLMKTSSMQSKCHNLHHKWPHRETNWITWLFLRTYLFCSASGKLHLLWYVYISFVLSINCTVLSVRCVTCFDCGATTPGVGCQWMSNYTQCGPCASKTMCPVCKIKYNTNDLMIQCAHCERYEHL